ncbi:MAG: hypothetical protein AAB448_00920, partial [Patescibacteria group bacterium]
MNAIRFLFLAALIFLLTPAAIAAPPASCLGLEGRELQVCNEQRTAAQAAQIAALKREFEALAEQCEEACDNAPSAPAPPMAWPPPWLIALEGRLAALEELVAGGVSDEDFDREIGAINAKIVTINKTLTDHERRLDELERKADEPPLLTPPIYVPGPQGPPGADGRDGRPAEIAVLAGVDGVHSKELSIVGLDVTLMVGGRPTDGLRLGGYGSGFRAGAGNLGFGAGGYLGYDLDWFRPSLTLGWREIGLGVT